MVRGHPERNECFAWRSTHEVEEPAPSEAEGTPCMREAKAACRGILSLPSTCRFRELLATPVPLRASKGSLDSAQDDRPGMPQSNLNILSISSHFSPGLA